MVQTLAAREDRAPFRSSKLTYLLAPLLGGEGAILLLAHVTQQQPAEAARTLAFAAGVRTLFEADSTWNRMREKVRPRPREKKHQSQKGRENMPVARHQSQEGRENMPVAGTNRRRGERIRP